MRLWTLIRRELWSLLVSPISYVICVLFYLFRGTEVMGILRRHAAGGSVDDFTASYLATASTQYMVVMVPPILTMRLLAEEKRTGSLELLMTAPVRDWEVVAGKWLATWVFYTALWLPTLLVLVGLQLFLGVDLPYGQVFTSYLGLLSLGSLLLAVGLFTSSLTDNQLLASMSSILFGIVLLAGPREFAEGTGISVDSSLAQVLVDQAFVMRHLALWFFRGHVDTGHMVFYVGSTLLFLFLTVRVVESRRWK